MLLVLIFFIKVFHQFFLKGWWIIRLMKLWHKGSKRFLKEHGFSLHRKAFLRILEPSPCEQSWHLRIKSIPNFIHKSLSFWKIKIMNFVFSLNFLHSGNFEETSLSLSINEIVHLLLYQGSSKSFVGLCPMIDQ